MQERKDLAMEKGSILLHVLDIWFTSNREMWREIVEIDIYS